MNNKIKTPREQRQYAAGFYLGGSIVLLLCYFVVPMFKVDALFFAVKLTLFQLLETAGGQMGSYLLGDYSAFAIFLLICAIGGTLAALGAGIWYLCDPNGEQKKAGPYWLGGVGGVVGALPFIIVMILGIVEGINPTVLSVLVWFVAAVLICMAEILSAGVDGPVSNSDPSKFRYDPAGPAPAGPNKQITNPALPGQAYLTLVRLNTGESWEITNGFSAILGRAPDVEPGESEVIIRNNNQIGRRHARIVARPENDRWYFYIVDLHSTNKTFVNDGCLAPDSPKELHEGDYITLANEIFQVKSIR